MQHKTTLTMKQLEAVEQRSRPQSENPPKRILNPQDMDLPSPERSQRSQEEEKKERVPTLNFKDLIG